MTLTENLMRGAAQALTGGTDGRVPRRALRSRRRSSRRSPSRRRSSARIPQLAGRVRDRAALARVCAAHGIEARPEFGAGKLQYELFEKTVETTLRGPVFVTQYPAEVSPLARCNDADPFVTDRFELFIGGRELANGFSELNDPEDQAARFRAQADAKAQRRRGSDVLRRRLRPRARVRHAAGGGPRRRHRSARDAADELAVDPRRAVVPAAEARRPSRAARRTAAAARERRAAARQRRAGRALLDDGEQLAARLAPRRCATTSPTCASAASTGAPGAGGAAGAA